MQQNILTKKELKLKLKTPKFQLTCNKKELKLKTPKFQGKKRIITPKSAPTNYSKKNLLILHRNEV